MKNKSNPKVFRSQGGGTLGRRCEEKEGDTGEGSAVMVVMFPDLGAGFTSVSTMWRFIDVYTHDLCTSHVYMLRLNEEFT